MRKDLAWLVLGLALSAFVGWALVESFDREGELGFGKPETAEAER